MLFTRHRILRHLINRRLRAQRQLVCGANYAFQESLQPVFSAKATLQKSLRRLYGRKVRGRRQRHGSIITQTLPRIVRLHPTVNSRLTLSTALIGARLNSTLLRKSTRSLRDASCPSKPKSPHGYFAHELQQELSVVRICRPVQILPRSKSDVERVVLKKAMHTCRRRFACKAYRAVE